MVEWVVPILQDVVDVGVKAAGGLSALIGLPVDKQDAVNIIVQEVVPEMQGQIFVRLAGVSGALSVGLGAYGAHKFKPETSDPHIRNVWDTANRYHMLHSLAMLAIPLTRRPYVVGSLMCAGTALFSGTCYYQCISGKSDLRWITPYGGMLLIAAWLAIAV